MTSTGKDHDWPMMDGPSDPVPESAFERVRTPHGGPCPGCNRIMSVREKDEQGMCNECLEGAA